MKHSKPHKNVEIGDLLLNPGQTITLWLKHNKDDEPYYASQVEVRVTWDHEPEIFADEDVCVRGFVEYYDDKGIK